MTDLELLVDFHKDAERQGPGSTNETIMALELIETSKGNDLKIADIGCGSGGQTITLAQNTEGQITAIDLFPEFLKKLNSKSKELGFKENIKTIEKSMEELPFANEEFDIIWSEGAIYNIGFKRGVHEWKKYLKTGGYLAVSEITWTTNSQPKEIEEYWNKEYPEIDTASGGLVKPDNFNSELIYFVSQIPYDWVFPKMYAVIHHGGSGTTHLALKYGCTTLIIPHFIDQFIWDEIISELGLGPKGIKISRITNKNLEPKVLELLSNKSFKEKSTKIGNQMKKEDFIDELYKTIIE